MPITQDAWNAAAARVELRRAQSEAHYLDVQRTRALNGQPHAVHLPSCPPACMEREIAEAAHRILALEVPVLTDADVDMFISGSTCECPHCGDLILRGCGRHLAKHAELTR